MDRRTLCTKHFHTQLEQTGFHTESEGLVKDYSFINLTNIVKNSANIEDLRANSDSYLQLRVKRDGFMDVAENSQDNNLTLEDEQLFVCKTDVKGLISYASKPFLEFNDYCEKQILGKHLEELLHPLVPQSLTNYMWSELRANREVFVYLKYRIRPEDSYWVFTNVTPGYAPSGEQKEFFFAQRKPSEQALSVIEPLYEEMQHKEATIGDTNERLSASFNLLKEAITQLGGNYEEFILGL